MDQTLHYDFMRGLILIEHGARRMMLDTGAPSSIGTISSIALAGRRHILGREYDGVTVGSMRAYIGVDVDVMLGSDILSAYDVLIDPEACDITFSDTHCAIEGEALELDLFGTIPVITASIGGTRVRMFFDTGAPLSYLSRDICRQHAPLRIRQDFHPRAGVSMVATYRVSITLGPDTFDYRVGTLPSSLQQSLRAAEIKGVLGTGLLRHFLVCFSPQRRRLTLKRLAACSAAAGSPFPHGEVDETARR